jgi:hypothetical protein
MWSVLLAVLAEGRSERDRRAGLHELRQRFGVGAVEDRRPAPFTQQVLDWGHRLRSRANLYLFAYHIITSVAELGGEGRVLQIPDPDRPGAFLPEQGYEVLLPGEPILHGQAAYDRALRRRTPVDRWLDWALREWERSGFDSAFATGFLLSYRGIRDWAEATDSDPTRLSWAEAKTRSDAWHAQFHAVGFGEVPRPGLVVLRWPNGWTLHRLLERAQFADEGGAMGHCIGGPVRQNGRPDGDGRFWKDTRDDRGAVFSLRNPAGHAEATASFVPYQGSAFLLEDLEGKNNRALPIWHRLTLLSAFSALGLTPETLSKTPLAENRGGVQRALYPPTPEERASSRYTGRPWLTLGFRTWREADSEVGREGGLLLVLEAVRDFARSLGHSIEEVDLRGEKEGNPEVRFHLGAKDRLGQMVVVKPGPDGALIQAITSLGRVETYPTLYEAYEAVTPRSRVLPYEGELYPDVSPEVRERLLRAVDIAGGDRPGMGRRSALLRAMQGADESP